jgi:transcriptional regulator with XRE-family HTH domain
LEEFLTVATAFGKVLRRLRKQAGLSQEQLGLDADLMRNYISILELGQQQPTIKTLFKLAVPLKRRPSEIIALVEDEILATASKNDAMGPTKSSV